MTISAGVGRGAENRKEDVLMVQQAINRYHIYLGSRSPLHEDGLFGPATYRAIKTFQQRVLQQAAPSGRICPDDDTFKALVRPPGTWTEEAVSTEWTGDEKHWPQKKKLGSMEPTLRARVEQLLADLTQQGFQPYIVYGWRSQERQRAIIARGHSRVKLSMHNITRAGIPHAYAADIVDRRFLWNEQGMPFFRALGKSARNLGLIWGGTWQRKDWAHVQSIPVSQQRRIRRAHN